MNEVFNVAQLGPFSEWVERWVSFGLSVRPADRARVETGIRACYRLAGLCEPEAVVWAPSPFAAVLEWPRLLEGRVPPLPGEILWEIDEIPDILFGPTLVEELAASLGEAVLLAITQAVSDPVGAETWHGIGTAIDAEIGRTVDESVSAAVGEALGSTGAHWQGRFGGSWWCAFQAWSAYLREVGGLNLPEEIWERDRAFAAAQSAGWWWPHRRFALVCDRPTSIARDEQGRLHCPTGPAITWSDGRALWFWHGVRVDGPEALSRASQLQLVPQLCSGAPRSAAPGGERLVS